LYGDVTLILSLDFGTESEDGRNYKFLNGWSPDGSRLLVSSGLTDLSIIKLKEYEDPLAIDLTTPSKGKRCELRVRCMSEPIADALLTLNGKEIGFTNSSGFLNYSCPDEGRYVMNASKTGYKSASKVLIVQENSSVSPVRSAASEPSSDSENKKDIRSETQVPGFRGITVFLILVFFITKRSFL
jgi:TolB protein